MSDTPLTAQESSAAASIPTPATTPSSTFASERMKQAIEIMAKTKATTNKPADSKPTLETKAVGALEIKAVNPPTVEDSADPKITEAFTRLGKQENYIREERTKLEVMKKSLEQDRNDVEHFRKIQVLSKQDPLKALESLGLNYETITNHVRQLQNPIDPTLRKVKEEVEALRQEQVAHKERESRQQLERAEKTLADQIDTHIAQPEYSLIKEVGAMKAVREFMETVYNETKEIPSVKDACEAVAAHIVETYSKVSSHPRFQSKQEVEQVATYASRKPNTTGLSNKLTSSTTIESKPMNERERMAAAIKVAMSIK